MCGMNIAVVVYMHIVTCVSTPPKRKECENMEREDL
jgi:hypothetical protein